MFKVNKQKCTSCQLCVQKCPGATKIGDDGKAEVINQDKLEECGGESICPFGAIEKVGEESATAEPRSYQPQPSQPSQPFPQPFFPGGFGRGMGKGMGAGRRRGFGIGPRDGGGRGRGRGFGGGRR